MDFFHIGNPFPKSGAQRFDARRLFGQVFEAQLKRFTHANNLVSGQSAGTHTALMTTTVHLRFDTHAGLATHK